MENKWEYNYSNLYGGAGGQAPNGAPSPGSAPATGDTGYVNAGSTGTNVANTAAPVPGADAQPGVNMQPGQPGPAGPGGPAGPAPTYSYSAMPPQQPPRKKGGAKKWALRLLCAVLVAAIGFGGGYVGSLVAAERLNANQHVVYQAVDNGTSTGASTDWVDVASMVSPSVVVITTEQMTTGNYWFGGSYIVSGAGSGVIMTEDGYIITNNHVVEGASAIKVTIGEDSYDATIVGTDSRTDIAVIKIEASGLTPAVMGDSDTLAVGEAVIAVGNPMGIYGGSTTSGIISGLNREVTVQNQAMSLIQTDAAVSPGNSGGGLFNASGELIGIVNSRSASSDAENIGFAVPINTALSVAQDLIANGYVTGRPQLGISVTVIADQAAAQYGLSTGGVYITAVNEGSGAAAAGLQEGDLIISVDDILVSSTSDVTGYIADLSVGDTVTVQVQRDGRLVSADVVLGESQS